MSRKHVVCILIAGMLWGSMGLYSRILYAKGFTPEELIIVRVGISAALFLIMILVKDRKAVRVKPKDLWCFFGSGIMSLMFFTYCYFNAIKVMTLSAAAILLYTAPVIVMLLSALLFSEKITKYKLIALVLSIAGCALASGIVGGQLGINKTGLLYGLGAGFGYALYSIFARFALNRGYSSTTVNLYSCVLPAFGAAVIFRPADFFAHVFQSPFVFVMCVVAALLTCFLPYAFYTYGLTGVENGKASVIASVEPVVASLIGIFVYSEKPDIFNIIGIVMVLAAIALLNLKTSSDPSSN
ncbi:MAG: EamA family transporter [Firmicutes bacterium]|nr:EamA family transporter [Bacillota bacterium]